MPRNAALRHPWLVGRRPPPINQDRDTGPPTLMAGLRHDRSRSRASGDPSVRSPTSTMIGSGAHGTDQYARRSSVVAVCVRTPIYRAGGKGRRVAGSRAGHHGRAPVRVRVRVLRPRDHRRPACWLAMNAVRTTSATMLVFSVGYVTLVKVTSASCSHVAPSSPDFSQRPSMVRPPLPKTPPKRHDPSGPSCQSLRTFRQ